MWAARERRCDIWPVQVKFKDSKTKHFNLNDQPFKTFAVIVVSNVNNILIKQPFFNEVTNPLNNI